MTNEEIRQKAESVVVDNRNILFMPRFVSICDEEITATFNAWLSNGVRGEEHAIKTLIHEIMDGRPLEYVRNYGIGKTFEHYGVESFFGLLSYNNLHNLLSSLHNIYSYNGTLEEAYRKKRKKNMCKYAHDVLSLVLGKDTGFTQPKATCTHYRLNLLLYHLQYHLQLWDYDAHKTLIPCNDHVFERAYELGVVPNKMKNNIRSAIELTKKAKEVFGEEYFYKMYEFLMYYGGE